MTSRFSVACVVLAALVLGGAACTDTESATNLHSSGVPSIEQVRLGEAYTDSSGNAQTQRVFAFGSFPGATPDIDHTVTTAQATAVYIRVIMGKLLLGNYMEQVLCRGPVRIDYDGSITSFDNVPVGATPDDIAKCSTTSDVLPRTCGGSLATCICQLPQGCGAIATGSPVGILDENEDGAADQMRFTPNSVGVKCIGANGQGITVPMNLAASYWNPSGFQQAPASCPNPPCYDELGPAIVLIPVSVPDVNGPATLPTNSQCGLTFAPDIVDKENQQVCAAPMGRPSSCDNENLDKCKDDQDCTPGDVSAFGFGTQPLGITPEGITDGQTGVSRTIDFVATANAPIDPGSIGNISVTQAGQPYSAFTITLPQSQTVRIHWTAVGGLNAMTTYTVTFPTTFTDFYKQGLPQPVTITFTTGA